MADGQQVRRRTGGRSARVRSAIHQAVNDLLAEGDTGRLTVAEIAERAEVNPTTIYRRWGSLEALVLDVEAERLQVNWPVRDTGTLRGDLAAYAASAAADITRPGGFAFLRAVMAIREPRTPEGRTTVANDGAGSAVAALLRGRAAQLQEMLDRASERGEPAPVLTDVLDCITAPIYLRTLLGLGGLDPARLATYVERTLDTVRDGAASPTGSDGKSRPGRRTGP